MKVLLILNLLIQAVNLEKIDIGYDQRIKSIAKTTTDGIFTICEHRDYTINIILPQNFSADIFLTDVLYEIIEDFAITSICQYNIKTIKNLKQFKYKTMRFSVFILKTSEIARTSKRITPNLFNFRMYYIFVLLNGNQTDIQNIFDEMWSKFIFNVNVIHCCNDDGEASIYTFMPFSNMRCSDTTPIKLTKDETFFREKMHNLHHCPIIAATSLDANPCVFGKLMSNGSYLPGGSDISVVKTLAEVLNFDLQYNFTKTQGFLNEDGSAQGPFKLLLDNKAHLAFDCYWLTQTRNEFFDSTAAYYYDNAVLIIPPGSELSPFEKLLYPFSWNVWIALCSCIFVGLIVIIVFKNYLKGFKNVIFGEKNQVPIMNMLSVLLGANQYVPPKNIFARLLLMNFLIFTLNMRSLYQGAMFELMNSNRKHDDIKSVDELKEKRFDIFVLKTTAEIFYHNANIKSR